MTIRILRIPALVICTSLGCSRGDNDAAAAADSGGAEQVAVTSAATTASGAVPGRIAAIPSDPCAWLPVADVEEVMGKLTGPPTPIGSGCRYPVMADSTLLARKTQLRDVVKQIQGASDSAAIRDTT